MKKQESDVIGIPNELIAPNKYVNYKDGDMVIPYSFQICMGKMTNLEKINAIFKEVSSYQYDEEKATAIQNKTLTGYMPNLTEIIMLKKGICYDKASLMVAMLRIQSIPSKLCMGHIDGVYHAWVEVKIDDAFYVFDPTYSVSMYKKPITEMLYMNNYIAEKYY